MVTFVVGGEGKQAVPLSSSVSTPPFILSIFGWRQLHCCCLLFVAVVRMSTLLPRIVVALFCSVQCLVVIRQSSSSFLFLFSMRVRWKKAAAAAADKSHHNHCYYLPLPLDSSCSGHTRKSTASTEVESLGVGVVKRHRCCCFVHPKRRLKC